MKITNKKAKDLKPSEYNPRQISTKQYNDLKKSIENFGLVDPIIINFDGTIIGGHQRFKVLQEMETENIPCVVLELNKKQEKELNIRLNKSGGEFDFDLLANHFDVDELVDWGFKHIDLDINIDKITEGNTEDDHIPEVKESRVKLGDVWQLGKNRLMCGDSTKKSDVEKLMNGDKADMVFTDPPYGVDYNGGTGRYKNNKIKSKTQNKIKNDINESIYNYLEKIILFNLKEGAVYIWYADKFIKNVINSFNVLELRSVIIWYKINQGFGDMGANYHNVAESCLYMIKGKSNFIGENNEKNVWELQRPQKNKLHPTQKPLELCIKAIKNHKAKIVLDLFLGSGSTLIACEKTNRICYGMELDTKYCDVIIERWEQFTGQKATKL